MKLNFFAVFLFLAPAVFAANSEVNWKGLSKERIDLALPLLIIKGQKGLLACGYISAETCNKTKEACAIVTGVKTHDDMLSAEVKLVSERAAELGIKPGMKGKEVLDLIR